MKLKNAFLEKYRSDQIWLAEWIFAIATGLLVFASTAYVDMISLTVWSTNVWDVIMDSNIRHLYEFSAQNIYHVQHQYMGSELLSVLPWSIWNIPIWIIQRFFGKPIVDSPLMLAYAKSFLVVLSVVTVIYTKKITYFLTGDRAKSMMAAFLTTSSIYIYITVCYAGQNDILMITASVIGIYCMIRNKRVAFIVWSTLAIAIKPFFLLAFLAVIMLYEKKIWRILMKAAFCSIGLVLQKLLFKGAPMYEESMTLGPSTNMLKQMFPANVNTSFGGVSFFAMSLVVIYLYVYTRDFNRESPVKDTKYFGEFVIYTVTLTYFCYVLLSPFSYYRLAVIIPFFYITMVQKSNLLFYNIALDTLMSAGLLMKLVMRGSSLFKLKSVNNSLIQGALGYKVDYTKTDYFESLYALAVEKNELIEFFQPLFAGVACVCGVLIVFFNHPDKETKLKVGEDKNWRLLLWIRTALIIPCVILILYMFTHTSSANYVDYRIF